jgi:ComF family protein
MPAVQALIGSLVALALPPRCPGCGAIVEADHRFCAPCWQSLRFLGEPCCAACRLPFEQDHGPGALCERCEDGRPAHDGVHAAVAYGEVARTVALKLKYGRRIGVAETMARAVTPRMPEGCALLVPVPLHRRRLWSRGYNQAALVAQAIGRARGIPVALDLLQRRRATPVLKGMGPAARARAVKDAFAVREGAAPILTGQSIALVDDVYTSGATASACARVLKQAGAARVVVLCWARVTEDAMAD